MSFRFHKVLLTGLTATALVVACTVNTTTAKDDGTRAVERSRASALVTGRLDANISGEANVYVNDKPRNVVIAPDHSFVVREVPSGTTTFAVEADGIRGSVTIDDVKAGEMIEVEARVEGQALVIVILRRDVAIETPREVTLMSGAPLEIRANNVCYFLRGGTYERDVVIYGNNVRLLGAGGCTGADHTVLMGALTVKGNNVLVQDIELGGRVLVEANRVRVQDSCTGCFADACYSGGKGGKPGPRCPDGKSGPDCRDGSSSSSSGGYDAGRGSSSGGGQDAGTGTDADSSGGSSSGGAADAGPGDGDEGGGDAG